ncbi:peroxisomal biogenesis factor 3-like [Panonychus citri]|uniref:peroxisomal biogenesis factor 3-like n=1 Tax=Panonychus citri TaxID=50023 RepID=UPI0023071A8D|nr:peroxisomal biogenesis factor 3-like [Panonychus citri]XP_053206112.1 peroxisomal biogenesis factor 3-like [Panonychus citri]
MSFISSGWQWIKRHKGKLMVASGVVGGFVVLNRYLSAVERNWENSSVKDFVSEVRKKEMHFDNTIQTCNTTVINLTPRALSVLDNLLNCETLLDKLKSSASSEEKLLLWEELKIRIITRITSEIYSLSLFVCFSRIQLSLIAGYLYVDCCKNGTTPGIINKNIQMYYLSLLETFFTQGIQKLIQPIQESVIQAVGSISLKERIELTNLKEMFDKIKANMNFFMNSPDFKISQYLVTTSNHARLNDPPATSTPNGQTSPTPEASSSSASSTSSNSTFSSSSTIPIHNLSAKDMAIIQNMLIETEDLLESEDFKKVINSTIDVGYSIMMDLLVGCFLRIDSDPGIETNNGFKNPHTQSVPFAKLLPPLNNTLKERGKSSDEALSLVRHLLCTDVINCFSANVYESFSGDSVQKS